MNAVVSYMTKLIDTKPKQPVEIGSKFTGKRELFLDSRTGNYSESLPRIDCDACLIQRALLRKGKSWTKQPT